MANTLNEVPSESERFNEKHVLRLSGSSTKDEELLGLQTDSKGVLDIAEDEEEPEDKMLAYASSSVIKFYPEWCQCMECLQHSEFNEQPSCLQYSRSICLCPPSGPVARIFTFFLEFALTLAFLWLLLKNVHGIPGVPSPAHPKGPIFALAILEFLGMFLGIVFKCFRLPSLLGPLVLGILLRNVHFLNLFKNFDGWNHRNCDEKNSTEMRICYADAVLYSNAWIQPIRLISLSLILTRAGLELSPKQLKKLKGVVPLLAFGPCVVEACTCAITIYLLFWNENINIFMCFVAGFALAAVSPAVVVPGMLSLKRRRLGEAQGIPTLLIAASSIDDVLAISAYSIFLGLAVPIHKETNWIDYTSGVLGFAVGIIHGFLVGMFLHFIPARDFKNLPLFRLVLLLLINISTMLFYERQDLLSGAGSVAVLVASFIASFRWRSEPHWKKPMGEIEHHLAHLWTLAVPLLFGTIGREIDFSSKGYTMVRVGKVIGVIGISLVFRCISAFFITKLAKLNWKERVFCMASWIPKATVQAALAPLVVSRIQEHAELDPSFENLKAHGQIVVLTAVLAVLITAPLGSVLIAFLGPRLLQAPAEDQQNIIDEEFPGGDGDAVLTIKDIDENPASLKLDNNPRNSGVNENILGIEVIENSVASTCISGTESNASVW